MRALLATALLAFAACAAADDAKPNRIERGVNKASKGVENTAKRVERGTTRTFNRTKKGIERAADRTEKKIKKILE